MRQDEIVVCLIADFVGIDEYLTPALAADRLAKKRTHHIEGYTIFDQSSKRCHGVAYSAVHFVRDASLAPPGRAKVFEVRLNL